MSLLYIHLSLRLGILLLAHILLAGIIFSLTVITTHLAVLAHRRAVKLLHYLVECLSIVHSWCSADPTRWLWTSVRRWITARRHTCSYLQEVLLSCLGHHEAHPSYPCVSVICLILDWILLIYQGTRLRNWSRICIWRLSPVHATIVHSVRYQGHRLLCRSSIWLYTLMSLIFRRDITCVIWHYSNTRSKICLILQLDQVDASLLLLVLY